MATSFVPQFDAARVEQMRALLKTSVLPDVPIIPPEPGSVELGIDLDWLKGAKQKLEEYDVKALEDKINQFQHFTVEIEGSSVHFIHERSARPDAIPLLMLHGWPGSFYDFHKIIKRFAHPENDSDPAFHVVVPSLPGYAWSSLPSPKSFSTVDMARIFDTLMTKTLEYPKYMGQGGDWGSFVLRSTAENHFENAPLLHFNFFLAPPAGLASYHPYLAHLPLPDPLYQSIDKSVQEWGLSEEEAKALRHRNHFLSTGTDYGFAQFHKPATIGYAIGASPLSLLAYLGEKLLAWSDSSVLDIEDVIATVAIYYLTDSFGTSVMIYNRSWDHIYHLLTPEGAWGGKMKSNIGYSAFPYENGASPRSWIARCANLVQYTTHSQGGHYAALENPGALVDDVRSLAASHWPRT